MSPPPIVTASTECTAWPTMWVDLFALKVMVPITHICWVHCVSWPFCTNTYCVHCMTHCVGWPFCTKGNGPHHPSAWHTAWVNFFKPYLSPHRYLLAHCIHCVHCMGPFALKVMVPTTHICWVLPFCTTTALLHCVPTASMLPYMPYIINLFALTKCAPHLVTQNT